MKNEALKGHMTFEKSYKEPNNNREYSLGKDLYYTYFYSWFYPIFNFFKKCSNVWLSFINFAFLITSSLLTGRHHRHYDLLIGAFLGIFIAITTIRIFSSRHKYNKFIRVTISFLSLFVIIRCIFFILQEDMRYDDLDFLASLDLFFALFYLLYAFIFLRANHLNETQTNNIQTSDNIKIQTDKIQNNNIQAQIDNMQTDNKNDFLFPVIIFEVFRFGWVILKMMDSYHSLLPEILKNYYPSPVYAFTDDYFIVPVILTFTHMSIAAVVAYFILTRMKRYRSKIKSTWKFILYFYAYSFIISSISVQTIISFYDKTSPFYSLYKIFLLGFYS